MSKNVEINISNGNGYEVLYPKTIPEQAGSLSISGGTLTGPLMLSRTPVESMEAVNKQYVNSNNLLNKQEMLMAQCNLIKKNNELVDKIIPGKAKVKNYRLTTIREGQFLVNTYDYITYEVTFDLTNYSTTYVSFNLSGGRMSIKDSQNGYHFISYTITLQINGEDYTDCLVMTSSNTDAISGTQASNINFNVSANFIKENKKALFSNKEVTFTITKKVTNGSPSIGTTPSTLMYGYYTEYLANGLEIDNQGSAYSLNFV